MSILLYSIYSITDTYFVSTGVNEFAAGGISVASPILSILGAMSTTVGTGGASIVSRMLGKGNKEDAANVTSNAMMVYWIFAIACTVLGLLFIEPLLQLLGCTDSLMVYAKGYACIILLGSITSTAFSAIIRAEGDTKFSMYMWMVPVITNLILDPLFILVLKWGVKGAALGTICAQMISVVMSTYFFFFKKRESYSIRRDHFKLRIHIVKEIFVIGFPSLVLSVGGSICAILINNILKSQSGDVAITAYGIVWKIHGFFIMPCSGIVQGMQPIVGYNFGMGDFKRVRNTYEAVHNFDVGVWCVGSYFRVYIARAVDWIVHT